MADKSVAPRRERPWPDVAGLGPGKKGDHKGHKEKKKAHKEVDFSHF